MKRVYIDEDVTPDLARLIRGHVVESTRSIGLAGTKNGTLMRLLAGQFDVIITRDRKMQFQQNLVAHGIGLVVLRTKFNSVSRLTALVPDTLSAIEKASPGDTIEILDDR